MKDEYGLGSEISYSERELIQRAIRSARTRRGVAPKARWVLVRDIFLTGSAVSRAICTRYGFDPDKEITPMGAVGAVTIGELSDDPADDIRDSRRHRIFGNHRRTVG